jgi:pimeloyl-ACP methyl ester carboxylesterase
MIRRGFVDVGGRAVHYRRAGAGPPVVMLHGSPGDGQMLTTEILACADHFTVFALDTAGFGYSDALVGDVLTVPELAAATAAAMRALGLPPCPVYGTHTGAAIAIEVGVGFPEVVTGVVLEGLPAFTDKEIEALFGGYFAPLVPDPLAGHLTTTWMRFRDQFTWFPWLSRDVTRLNAIPRPGAEDIDLWVTMFYRSCKTYRPAYRAACYYGQAAIRAAAALRVPAVYTAAVEDMLFPHLDRLPALGQGQTVEKLPSAEPGRSAAIIAFLARFPAAGDAPGEPVISPNSAKLFIGTPHGQVFVRRYGDPGAPAVVLLHDAPGTSLGLHELATALAPTRHVIVPDHPGSGLTGLPGGGDILDAAADNVLAATSALGAGRFAVAALGCGAAVAARLTARAPARITTLAAAAPPHGDTAFAGQVAPEIALSPTGAHWLKAWLMLRDGQIYDPWFDGSVVAQRRTQGNFDAVWLHDQTAALMEGRATYHQFARAAASCSAAEALAGCPAAVMLSANSFNAATLAGIL